MVSPWALLSPCNKTVITRIVDRRTEAWVGATSNVRVKLRATAGSVSLVREDVRSTADQAYAACRSVSA